MRHLQRITLVALLLVPIACGGGVDSDAEAEAAYLGLDRLIGKSINLGFDGFNAANSANIPEQTATGDVMGSVAVNGQVDQGASDNKGMRLTITLTEYQDAAALGDDELSIIYDTIGTLPDLDLQLRDIPDGTLEGTLEGVFTMRGDLEDDVRLDLSFSGSIEPGSGGDTVQRVEGTTSVTGTATSAAGTFEVDVTI